MFDATIFDRLELLETQNKVLTENSLHQTESTLGLLDALAERKKVATLLREEIVALEDTLADARAVAKIYLAEIEAVKTELLLVHNDLGELEEEVKARKPKLKTVRSLHNGHYYEVVAEGSSLNSYGGFHEVVVLKATFPNGLTDIVVVDACLFEKDFAYVSG